LQKPRLTGIARADLVNRPARLGTRCVREVRSRREDVSAEANANGRTRRAASPDSPSRLGRDHQAKARPAESLPPDESLELSSAHDEQSRRISGWPLLGLFIFSPKDPGSNQSVRAFQSGEHLSRRMLQQRRTRSKAVRRVPRLPADPDRRSLILSGPNRKGSPERRQGPISHGLGRGSDPRRRELRPLRQRHSLCDHRRRTQRP